MEAQDLVSQLVMYESGRRMSATEVCGHVHRVDLPLTYVSIGIDTPLLRTMIERARHISGQQVKQGEGSGMLNHYAASMLL